MCYRPPSNNTDVIALQYAKDMYECIEMLVPCGLPVLIYGDFNFPNVDWSVDNCALSSESTCEGVFSDMYYNYGLHQFVPTPARLNSLLDLVFAMITIVISILDLLTRSAQAIIIMCSLI